MIVHSFYSHFFPLIPFLPSSLSPLPIKGKSPFHLPIKCKLPLLVLSIFSQVYYHGMATQRIKNLESIEYPYHRASNEITQLQVKDAHLHSTILSLRDKIQTNRKDRNCKACRIFEDEIALLKNQEKDKATQFEATVSRLEEDKQILAERVMELYSREHQSFSDEEVIELHGKKEEGVSPLESCQVAAIVSQNNILKDIEQKAIELRLKEKRERQLLKKLKKRRESSSRDAEPKSNAIISEKHITHRKTNSEDPILQSASHPDPEVDLQISELQEKSAYFEQLSQSLERELKEQNQLKEQDSLRIINLLGEIENYKNELQNMDRFYQNKCAQLEQEKERIGYELSAELRSKESDLSHLKAYIESSKQASGSLDQLKQEKEAEIYRLKKENSSLELLLAQVKSQAESAGRDNEAKASQLATLSSSLSNLEADHLILSNKLDQWQLLSQQMTEKCNILCSQIASLQQRNSSLQASLANQSSKLDSNELSYLKDLLQQKMMILSNREDQIAQLQNKLALSESANQERQRTFEESTSTLARTGETLQILEKERAETLRIMQNLTIEKQALEQELRQQTESKAAYSQKYLAQADKNNQWYKKYNSLDRSFEEYKKTANSSLQLGKNKQLQLDQLTSELQQIKLQIEGLSTENNALKGKSESQSMDLSRLAQELEMTVSLKEARERELETKNQELQQGAFFNNQLYHDVVHFKEENGFLISKLKELEQVILQLEDHCSRSIKDIELHEDEKQGLRNSLEQLRLENSDIIRFCANEKQGYDQLVVSLKEELSRTRQKYGESEKELEKESGKIAALASDKLGLEAANHQLVLEKTKQDEYCQQLLKEVRSLTSINESLVSNAAPKAELQRLDKEIRHKDTRITQLEGHLSKSKQRQEEIQQLYDQASKKIQALTESESKYAENVTYLNQKIESLNKVYQSASGESTEELIKELNKKKQMIAELLTNFKYVEKALKKKEQDFDQLTEKHDKFCKNTEKEKFELESRLSLKEGDIVTLKREREEEVKRGLAKQRELEKQMQQLQDDLKQKDKLYHDDKRNIEKELARISEEKRKFEQSSAREINTLKEALQGQRRRSLQASQSSSPVKADNSAKKQLETYKRTAAESKLRVLQLERQAVDKQAELERLKEKVNEDDTHIKEISYLLGETEAHLDVKVHELTNIEERVRSLQSEITTLKSDLASKSQEVKRLEGQHLQLSKEQTEKNLANDFLWMQLEQEKNAVKTLERRLNESRQPKSHKKSQEILIQTDSFIPISKSLNDIEFVQSDLKEIDSILEQAEREMERDEVQLPVSSLGNQQEFIEDLRDLRKEEDPKELEQIRQLPKKSSKNLLFQNTLSDAMSDSEQNDEIKQMSLKESDHRSHMESSIEAFSEYSRIKSTKSQLTHNQVEEHYKNKIKNSKLMAKLGKRSKKN